MIHPAHAVPDFRPLEARLYLDRALAVVNRDLSGSDAYESEDVACAFVDALAGDNRLRCMSVARGPAPKGHLAVVTTADGRIDARASEALALEVLSALYGVVGIA